MADNDRRSNWRQAVDLLESQLVCRFCGAANRPGATYVSLEQDGRALCMVCGKAFLPAPA